MSKQESDLQEAENRLLEQPQRGMQLGNYVAVCAMECHAAEFEDDDKLIKNYHEQWAEHWLLANYLLNDADEVASDVDFPNDFGQIIVLDMPTQAPTVRNLTREGRDEYDVENSDADDVNEELADDYGVEGWRSIYHRASPPPEGWEKTVKAALEADITTIHIDFDGNNFTYIYDEENENCWNWTENSTRRGSYPSEQTFIEEGRFDVLPPIPAGVTANVEGKEFVVEEGTDPPFRQVRFLRYEVPTGNNGIGFVYDVQFGNALDEDYSIATYLTYKYPAEYHANPTVQIVSIT